MKHTDVAIIIVTYRFPRTKLSQLLSSLLRIGVKKGNIFIRDNTRDNIGYAGAINEIVKKQIQKYTYFLILNPDISFTENFIAPLLETVRQGKADIAGPVLYDETGKVWATTGIIDKKRFSAGLETKKLHHLTYVDYVPGTAMLIKKDVFEETGFFAEDYFLYYDEVDFAYRAAKAGFIFAVDPRASITHFSSFTVGKTSDAKRYYAARNHLLFVERFAPFLIKVREFIRLPRTIYQARSDRAELLGIRDYFLRRFGRNDRLLYKTDKI